MASAANELAAVATDAWSVTSNGLPPQLQGVEQQLFQVGLAPYLAYLWFLSREETKTPPLSNFGARFLLLFVFATIPAGIVAKKQFGDILANVDVLHGSSESLLTLSNLFFALGFARALSRPFGEGDAREAGAVPWANVAKLVAIVVAGCGASSFAFPAMLSGAGVELHAEPANALSLPTWAVHVSSVTEWALAMGAVWRYAGHSGNERWKGLTLGMSPFLASGLAACTFHTFYNAPEIGALVPLQALLTLTGNTACAFAAWRIWEEGKRMDHLSDATSVDDVALSVDELDEDTVILKLAAFSVLGSVAIKYGELCIGDFPFNPSYNSALSMVLIPSALYVLFLTQGGGEVAREGEASALSMDRVKSFGVSGTISYVIVELAFWALAFPAALSWYRVAEGTWLDLSDPTDKARLLGAGTVFINGVRLLVPFRLASAIALAPTVDKALEALRVDAAAKPSDDEA